MSYYSPAIMARFQTVEMPIRVRGRQQTQILRAYHLKATMTEFFDLWRAASSDGSQAARIDSARLAKRSDRWLGFSEGSKHDFKQSGRSIDAQHAFDKANSRLDAKGKPAAPEYHICGGAWSIPRVLAGHPLTAIVRPRTALPPKTIRIASCFASYVSADDVARPLAKVARAAWDYIKQGGAITITMDYAVRFSLPQDGHHGFILSLSIPLTNISALATACSVQFFRVAFLSMASGLSGDTNDNLPTAWVALPNTIQINGNDMADTAALASIGIK